MNLVVLSAKPEDLAFARAVAGFARSNLAPVDSLEKLAVAVDVDPQTTLFWDADGHAGEGGALFTEAVVVAATKGKIPASRIWALTSKLCSEVPGGLATPEKADRPVFQHNIVRRYTAGLPAMVARLVRLAHETEAPPFEEFFPPDTSIQKIQLVDPAKRRPAVDAVQNFLGKMGADSRIAAKVAQACDEMMMNAIFDAPRDREGRAVRNTLDRNADFMFSSGETVDLQFAHAPDFSGFCVSDIYGSVMADTILKYLWQNFHHSDYRVRKASPGAGLGLYEIIQYGISFAMVSVPKKRTDTMIFVPNIASYKAFRGGFHFFSVNARSNPLSAAR